MENIYPQVRRLHIKMAIPSAPKLTQRINAIPNKIQVSFLKETDKRILKVIQEGKGPFILKKNKAGRVKIPDLKTYYKVIIKTVYYWHWASQVALVVKNLPARHEFDPSVEKIRWRRTWQPTPVFLPGGIPQTEEPDGLQSIGSQSWTQLKQLSTDIQANGM